jgi:hypothetical protein
MGAQLEDRTVALYFNEGDLNNDGVIHYKEFLLCIGFLFFLDDTFTPAHHGEELAQVRVRCVCVGGGGLLRRHDARRTTQRDATHQPEL